MDSQANDFIFKSVIIQVYLSNRKVGNALSFYLLHITFDYLHIWGHHFAASPWALQMLRQTGQSPLLEPSSRSWTHVRAAGWKWDSPMWTESQRWGSHCKQRKTVFSPLLSLILLRGVPRASLPRRQEAVECEQVQFPEIWSRIEWNQGQGDRREMTKHIPQNKQTN